MSQVHSYTGSVPEDSAEHQLAEEGRVKSSNEVGGRQSEKEGWADPFLAAFPRILYGDAALSSRNLGDLKTDLSFDGSSALSYAELHDCCIAFAKRPSLLR